jgi:hypothetical protein
MDHQDHASIQDYANLATYTKNYDIQVDKILNQNRKAIMPRILTYRLIIFNL